MEAKEVKKWQDEEALKRYRMIAPLLDPDLDEGKRQQMREEAAERNGISKRTLYRYEKGYREEGFEGLRPAGRTKKRQQRLPENFEGIMEQAIQLKREVPKRSVRQIIKVLELEGWAQPGALKQSTVQRHLYDAGLGKKQMKRYAEKRETSSRRFCRPHRMELLQGDIKYGPDLRTTDGELVKTYLSSLIDDHSRYIVQSEFYDNQRQEIVEDTFHKAVLKAGRFDCAYLDNGVQYTAGHLGKACAKLGIRLVHAKPGACQSKGKIEKFHQKVDQFIAEIRAAHVHSVEELNRRWKIFLEQEYQKEAHAGIKEYYESYGASVPACGITPEQEWMRDTRGLIFMDVSVVAEAFLHHETRRIDEAGCFSLSGSRYEASAALANMEAEVAYDPMDMETVMVSCRGAEPLAAHRMEIGAFASKVPPVPVGMTGKTPETSRLLDALEKNIRKTTGRWHGRFPSGSTGRRRGGMYESFFEMEHTPFARDIPVERLYTSPRIEDALGRLVYVVDHQMFAVVTAPPGCGKSTMVRMLNGRLGKEKYLLLYLSDSKLTPRWLYAGLLGQLGLEPHFFSGDSKRLLQKEIESVSLEQKKKVVCVLDEAHLLGKDMLEELRFLMNYKFDSTSPMSLVLVGQSELWEQKLRLQAYEAIRRRIDMNIVLGRLDRAETGKYIAAHMAYAGAGKEIFTSGAEEEIYKISAGIPRMINRVCEKALMYACQQQRRLVDEHMVRFVADHEMLGGVG